MAQKFVDGKNIDCSSVKEVIDVLNELTAAQKKHAVVLTDAKGNHVERIRLFSQRLTDGSEVYNIELQFEDN